MGGLRLETEISFVAVKNVRFVVWILYRLYAARSHACFQSPFGYQIQCLKSLLFCVLSSVHCWSQVTI